MPNKTRKLRISGILGIAVLSASLAGCGSQSAASVVATYNGGTVTQSQLQQQISLLTLLNPQAKLTAPTTEALIVKQYIVSDRILLPLAAQHGFTPPQAQVQQDVVSLKQQLVQSVYKNSASSLNTKMQSLNLTDSDLAKIISENITLNNYAASLIPSSAITAYYKQNLAQYTTASQRAILVKTLPEATRIYGLLKQSSSVSNWDKLAKQYSQDPGSKNNGGLYSNQPVGNWVPTFQQHVLTQPLNRLGSPFHTRYGYFVMQVLNRHAAPISQVKSTIAQQLMSNPKSPYAAKYTAMVSALQKKANIKVTV